MVVSGMLRRHLISLASQNNLKKFITKLLFQLLFKLEGAILSYVILIQMSQDIKSDAVDYSKISNQLGMCVLQNKVSQQLNCV